MHLTDSCERRNSVSKCTPEWDEKVSFLATGCLKSVMQIANCNCWSEIVQRTAQILNCLKFPLVPGSVVALTPLLQSTATHAMKTIDMWSQNTLTA